MKFRDIRVLVKTGGGREMTVGRLFEGMRPYIEEVAGEGAGPSGVTEQQAQGMIDDAVAPLAQQVAANTGALESAQTQISDNTQATSDVAQNLTTLEGQVGEQQTEITGLSEALATAQQELATVKQQNADMETRLAALEAAANGA